MKRLGPLLTLAVGGIVAAVLMVLNINATNTANSATPASATGAETTGSSAAAPTTAPVLTSAPPTTAPPAAAGPPVTYAGGIGNGTTIAIAVKDGTAVAYLCDGARTEAWLQGPATGGQLTLTGDNATLTGTYANGVVSGNVSAAGRVFAFSVGKVEPPSGLYRAAAEVANAQVVGGWIVLANGTQVGIQRKGSTVGPAAPLNVTDRTSTLDGAAVTVTAVDGTKL